MTKSECYLRFIQSLPIRTRELQIVPFRLNAAQWIVWTKYIAPALDRGDNLWFLFLKARRLGISTLLQALLVARTVFEENIHALTLASKKSNTMEIWNMASLMYEHSPLKWLGQRYHQELMFGKSKYRVATAGTPDASRGFDLTIIHGSEVAFWEKPETWTATVQCLPDTVQTFCFLESTANGRVGVGKLLYTEWQRATRHKSGFVPIFLPWFANPGNQVEGVTELPPEEDDGLRLEETELVKQFSLTPAQMAWRRKICAEKCSGDWDLFHQEYPSTPEESFVVTGLPFFRAADIMAMRAGLEEGRRYRVDVTGRITPDAKGPLTIFRKPQDGHRYVIGGDSSMGIDDDARSKSTMEVLDMATLEQVAEYELAAAPHVFGPHMVGLARYYFDALIAPEVQASGGGGGREVLKYIKDEGYWNFYTHRHIDHHNEKTRLIGWETSMKTRPRMLARIRQAVQQRSATIHSDALLSQLSYLGESDAHRTEALTGHDDLVFAWGIALVVCADESYKLPDGTPVEESVDWTHMGMKVMRSDGWTRRHQALLDRQIASPESYLAL